MPVLVVVLVPFAEIVLVDFCPFTYYHKSIAGPQLWAAAHYYAMAYWPLGRVSDWPVCAHAQPTLTMSIGGSFALMHGHIKAPAPQTANQKGWGILFYSTYWENGKGFLHF